MRTLLAAVLVAGIVAGPGSGPASAMPGCSGSRPGGEWRSMGKDLANTRHQDAPTAIDATRAADLTPEWVFTVTEAGGSGTFGNTPAVADGCVYVSTSSDVFALDADTGAVVWRYDADSTLRGSPTVVNGRVYVNVDRSRSLYTLALDQASGSEVWRSVVDTRPGTDLYSSPVVFDGMILVGVSGAGAEGGTTFLGTSETRLDFRGTYVLLDETTGAVLRTGPVIDDFDFTRGYTGGGIWSTAAVDTESGYAYVGTGNPFSAREHPNTNAIIKIDVDPSRPTFGEIVGSYHGTYEQYVEQLEYKPVCGVYLDVFTCHPTDVDFGASPQLFSDPDGRKLVGDLQKSGVYHAADAATMQGVWQATLGTPPTPFHGSLGTAAFDGTSIYAGFSAPGVLGAMDRGGAVRWASPIADGIHVQPVTSANGVVYSLDLNGVLHVWGSDGTPLAAYSMAVDTSGASRGAGALSEDGVAVAHDTVFVPTGGSLIAYR